MFAKGSRSSRISAKLQNMTSHEGNSTDRTQSTSPKGLDMLKLIAESELLEVTIGSVPTPGPEGVAVIHEKLRALELAKAIARIRSGELVFD